MEHKQLLPTECAYLAATIEGEGCIRIDKVLTKKGTTNYGWRPTVHVTQKGREWLNALNDMYPGTMVESHGPKHLQNFRIAWSWGRAYSLLEQVLPYMKGPKRKQAEIVLRFHKTIHEERCNGHLSQEQIEWRDTQCKVLGFLKKNVT